MKIVHDEDGIQTIEHNKKDIIVKIEKKSFIQKIKEVFKNDK